MHAYSSSSSSQHHDSSTWASSSSFHVWNHEGGRRACTTWILTGPSVPWMDGSTWTDAIWAHVFNPVLCLTHFSSPVPVIARSFIAPPKESIISQDIYNISSFWREDKIIQDQQQWSVAYLCLQIIYLFANYGVLESQGMKSGWYMQDAVFHVHQSCNDAWMNGSLGSRIYMILGFIWSLIQMVLEVECMLRDQWVIYALIVMATDASTQIRYILDISCIGIRHAMQHQGQLRCYCQGRSATSLQLTGCGCGCGCG